MPYRGNCFCGRVTIEAEGVPEAMGYCHCSSCRAWAAAPLNAFTLRKKEAVRVTAGKEHLAVFARNPSSERQYCRACGGHVMTWHPGFGLMDIYAAILPDLAFTPALHVNYTERVLPIRDGLPKLRDFPAPLGGSGETIPE